MLLDGYTAMQNAGNINRLSRNSVNDDMLSRWKYPVFRRQFRAAVTNVRVFPYQRECLVRNSAVSKRLSGASGFESVMENVGVSTAKVLISFTEQI